MARTNLQEVETSDRVGNTVRERLSDLASTYVKIIEGFPTPGAYAKFHEGHRLDAKEARALNAFRVDVGSKSAAAGLKREIGKRPNMTDAERQRWLTEYMAKYELSDDIGGMFSESLFDAAASRVATDVLKSQGKPTDEPIVAAIVATITTSPEHADKYTPLVEAAAEAILAERHEKTERKASETEEQKAARIAAAMSGVSL